MIGIIGDEQEWDYKQTANEIEQCAGCYANPRADAQAHLQSECQQARRQMHACGISLR